MPKKHSITFAKYLRTVKIQNFKAIRDTGVVGLSPFTLLIGRNGSGKSSLIEALEAMRYWQKEGHKDALSIIEENLAPLKDIQHKFVRRQVYGASDHLNFETEIALTFDKKVFPSSYKLDGAQALPKLDLRLSAEAENFDDIWFSETLRHGPKTLYEYNSKKAREHEEFVKESDDKFDIDDSEGMKLPPHSAPHTFLKNSLSRWVFLNLSPLQMRLPHKRTSRFGTPEISKDGASIAEYLQGFAEQHPLQFQAVIKKITDNLDFVQDVQPQITSEIDRKYFIQILERGKSIPSWLLSSGTLRLIALIAVLYHPNPPHLLVIDELENGMDQETVRFVMDELVQAEKRGIQVIATTHNAYLVNMLDEKTARDSVIFCYRTQLGAKYKRLFEVQDLSERLSYMNPGEVLTSVNLTELEKLLNQDEG